MVAVPTSRDLDINGLCVSGGDNYCNSRCVWMVAVPTSRDLDTNGLCVSGGASSVALATGSGDDFALTMAAPTCGLHVEESSVDYLLQREGELGARGFKNNPGSPDLRLSR